MEIKNFYDIVVVGSGPAGSMTALTAAKNGASVLILERDKYVGIPVRCAEGISKRGLTRFFEPDERWISTKIKGAKLYAPNGESCPMISDALGDGYVLERRLFDEFIAKRAIMHDADLLTEANVYDLYREDKTIKGVKFSYHGNHRTVECNIVIGADGPESNIGKAAGLDTKLSLHDLESAAQYLITNIDYDSDYTHFYFGNHIAPGGYVWVFPKDKNTANVGIGVRQDQTDRDAKSFLEEWISHKFKKPKSLNFVTGCVPTAKTLPEITQDKLMLVGDAARQVNPVTGGGLSNILLAGFFAGTTAAQAIEAEDYSQKFLKQYRKTWMKEKGKKQKINYRLKKAFFNFTNEELNETVGAIQEIPTEKLTLFELFKAAAHKRPSLIKDLIKVYL